MAVKEGLQDKRLLGSDSIELWTGEGPWAPDERLRDRQVNVRNRERRKVRGFVLVSNKELRG